MTLEEMKHQVEMAEDTEKGEATQQGVCYVII